MTLFLLLQVTLVLGMCLGLLRLGRSLSAGQRHLFALVSVVVTLLLPLTVRVAPWSPGSVIGAFQVASRAIPKPTAAFPVLWVWKLGVALVLITFLLQIARQLYRVYRAVPVTEPALVAALAAAADEMNVAPCALKWSGAATPHVWGWGRAVLLLPQDAKAWTGEQLRLVLLHELAHLRRHDPWTLLLVALAQALYWFHPLMWLVTRCMEGDRELACDDLVLDTGAPPAAYADLLLTVARLCSAPPPAGCAMISDPQTLKGRIMRILKFRTRPKNPPRLRLMAMLFMLSLLAVCLLGPARSAAQDEIYKIGGDVKPPVPISRIDPEYTPEAKQAKIEGTVQLSVVINKAGLTEQISVIRGIDNGLNHNAEVALQQWRFEPATKSGQPVSVRATVEINFRLL